MKQAKVHLENRGQIALSAHARASKIYDECLVICFVNEILDKHDGHTKKSIRK